MYRAHDYGGATGLKVDAITTTANSNGEYIEVNNDKTRIYLHVKYFSTYIIGYLVTSGPRGSVGYTINAMANTGGIVSPNDRTTVLAGNSATYMIIPDDGYSISDVLVDGTSVGVVSSYTFSNIRANHTIQAEFTKSTGLPYYYDGSGNKVFIGFTSDKSGTMKYIAPKGVTVQFMPNPKNFTDVADNGEMSYIDFVTQREIFIGTASSIFSPNTGMTRAMFAAVIGRLYERSYGALTVDAAHAFTDVEYDGYYGKYVDWELENNIIIGIGGGHFDPNREITREEMATILYRFAGFLGASTTGYDTTQLSYPDFSSFSSWATEATKYCQQTGIIVERDDGYFVPQGTVTRAEVTAIVQRFIELAIKVI